MLILVLGTGVARAAGIGIGVGAFGGTSVPLIQDDAKKSGGQFGVRVPVSLMSFLTVEPFYATSSLGDTKQTIGGIEYTRSGFDVKTFGANAILGSPATGSGFKFFPFAGISSNKLTRVGSDEIKETGYDFGLGIGGSIASQISFAVRGELNMVKTGDTSRKFANANFGLSYNLTSFSPH